VVVKQLLDTGKVDPDAMDNDGWTSMSWAAGNGNTNVLRSLLSTGRANADARGPYQRTSLWWAS
jgi:ankyrin repeat protein